MDEIFETGILNWGNWERDRETKTEKETEIHKEGKQQERERGEEETDVWIETECS